MRSSGIKYWSLSVLLAFALLWAPNTEAATPASWKETGMTLNANGMTLREVFNDFGRTYGVRVSTSINDSRIVRGRLKAPTGSEFLDRLGQEYKFRWFVYNDVLHIVPGDDNVSLRLEVGEDAVQDAKAALVGLGLFESRFGWGELPDEGVVIVSGPRAYANLARDILMPSDKNAAVKAAKSSKQIMLFRLKYASATDRVINVRGKQETIPGIKTILNNLLMNGGTQGKNDSGHNTDNFDTGSAKRSRQPKNGKGGVYDAENKQRIVDSRSRDHDEEEESSGSRSSKSKNSSSSRDDRPRIEADPSLNAIMIYDALGKRDMYQALINDLDVEPQQVEIEALIVDIDRSKLSEMGVEWGITSRNGSNSYTMNSTNADSNGVDLPLPGSTLLISNAARFYARLKALEGTGQARVLAKPTVLTLDNVAAVLDLSQTAYVSLVGERVADLADVTAGTMLRVVPRIVREGAATKVRLEVDIEDGTLNGDPSLKSGTTRSTISTQAIIDLQQTLMIGGYHADSLKVDNQKVPFLGDVPVVGNLFRSRSENHSTKERLFLITPRITGSGGSVSREPAQEPARYKELPPAQSVQAPAPTAPAAAAPAAPAAPVAAAPAPAPAAKAAPVAAATTAASVAAVAPAAPATTQAVSPRADTVALASASRPATKKNCVRPKGAKLLPEPI